MKVSDEFTVPLCAIHHDEVHRTTKERAWWQQRDIDPLPLAAALWREGGGARGSSDETETVARETEANAARSQS
jgi:hypothetical protein